jgi:hypothetical protein
MRPTVLAITALVLSTAASSSSTEPAPGGIRLLPGYQHTPLRGIDSVVGDIAEMGGLTIGYDIGLNGRPPVNVARLAESLSWYREQRIAGRTVVCGKNKDAKTWVVALPGAGFYAEVRTPEEMADLLLTALTFEDGEKRPKR